MKALKALVIGMGVAIILGLGIVVAKLLAESGPSGASAGLGDVHLGLPDACGIAGVAAVDDLLAVRPSGPADARCGAVLLVDPETGSVVGRVHPGSKDEAS